MKPSVLHHECQLFATAAESVRVVDNTDPFLRRLSELKTFDQRIEFADRHCQKKLGEGSSRTAFDCGGGMVLKVSHNPKGIAQSLHEMDVSRSNFDCVNNAVVGDPEGKWILFEQSKELTEKRFDEIVGFSFKHFTTSLFSTFNNESDHWKEPSDYDEIKRSELFACCSAVVWKYDLLIGDLSKISSYRERDGKVLLADCGLSKDVHREHYQSTSSSSSPSD